MSIAWRGCQFDQSTIDKLKRVEQRVGFTLSFPQGSYSNGSLSAGTHAGGGAVDVHCVGYATADKVKLVAALDAEGFEARHRPYNWDGNGGGEHVHALERGNPNLSSAAAAQLVYLIKGRSGLVGEAMDSDPIDLAAAKATPPPLPQPDPAPVPTEETIVKLVEVVRSSVPKGTTWPGDFLLLGDGTLKHIKTVDALAAYKALGLEQKTLTYAQYQALQGGLG